MDGAVAITLFRHGLTEANKRHSYLGWTDSSLCPIAKGKMQRVDGSFEFLFSSDLNRCISTAKLLFPDHKPEVYKELREMHFGQWEGKTYDDLKHDEDYQIWLTNPFSVKPPEGESFAQFTERVEQGWRKVVKRLADLNAKKIAIMTHGGVIRHLLSEYANERKDFWEWEIPHAEGYELIWQRDGLRSGERCTLLRVVPLMVNPNG